jgi:hypothetical protein
MSLTPKIKLTRRRLAANRANAHRSRGAATPAGKARSAVANLRHGFYSQAQDEALVALGEDPDDLRRLAQSLMDDLQPSAGLETEVVKRMIRALWRLQRSDRIQDSLAVQRVRNGIQQKNLLSAPQLTRVYDTYERLTALSVALQRPDYNPSAAEIQAFEGGFGRETPADIQKLFPLLRALREAARNKPAPAHESHLTERGGTAADEKQAEAARRELADALFKVASTYRRNLDSLTEELEKIQSPENVGALMAPREETAKLMQRMEDSSLRQLWRLTNLLIKVRGGGLTPKHVKNED